jgi:hypothetical protein
METRGQTESRNLPQNMTESGSKSVITAVSGLIALFLLYRWHAQMEWDATREGVIKEHLGERITPETLKEIDQETSDIIQEGRDRDRD